MSGAAAGLSTPGPAAAPTPPEEDYWPGAPGVNLDNPGPEDIPILVAELREVYAELDDAYTQAFRLAAQAIRAAAEQAMQRCGRRSPRLAGYEAGWMDAAKALDDTAAEYAARTREAATGE
ncbi:MAG TPA: hypothetical protein VFM54_06865, partial [Micromonosporaceae bacterium]|nr:hypothetical protein [Micromonosporaceae bacterium]